MRIGRYQQLARVRQGFETASGTTDEQEREKENVSHTSRRSTVLCLPIDLSCINPSNSYMGSYTPRRAPSSCRRTPSKIKILLLQFTEQQQTKPQGCQCQRQWIKPQPIRVPISACLTSAVGFNENTTLTWQNRLDWTRRRRMR